VLSFLEGASVLAGIILVAAGVLGLSSIQDLRSDNEAIKQEVLERLEQVITELTERVEVAERELGSKVEHLTRLEREMEQTIEGSQSRIDTQIQTANRDARRAFEALSHHVMAQRLARENNIDAAIKTCRDAHSLDPDNVPNNYLLGLLLIRRDELDEAIEHLTHAYEESRVDSEQSITPAQAALGLALRLKGDKADDIMVRNLLYNQSENYLLEATSNDPQLLNEQNESYFGTLGSLYRRQGRTEDAIVAYLRAAEATPRRSYPEINLAMLYLEADDETTSERHRLKAEILARRRLDDTPEDYWAGHDLALATLLKGDPENALRIFGEALELTPDVMTLGSVLARLNYLLGLKVDVNGLAEAVALFTKARQRFTTAMA
jgi:tetratricopeptide (TPR) repeat protein